VYNSNHLKQLSFAQSQDDDLLLHMLTVSISVKQLTKALILVEASNSLLSSCSHMLGTQNVYVFSKA